MLPTALGVGVAPGTPTQASDYSSLENNRLSAGSYDNRGNLLAYTAMGAMTYTAQNKMATMTRTVAGGTTTGEYVYDGLGQRIQRVTKAGSNPAVSTYYIYDAMGRLAQERSTATPAPQDQGLFFRTTDHLGSTRLITTAGGAVYRRHDFLPFGEDIPTSVGGRAGATGYNPLPDAFAQRFTAKERDDESGLDYFGARYYGSSLGRFTGVDPNNAGVRLGNPQSWNGYGYSINNPLRYVDPDGRDFLDAVEGFANAFGSNAVGGIGRVDVGSRPSEAGDFRLGQAVGDAASVVAGTLEVLGGLGTGGAGIAACSTGAGCLATAPAVAEGAILVTQGGALATSGFGHLLAAAVDGNPTSGDTGTANDGQTQTSQGPKAADAPGTSASGQATNQYGQKLGPSGKPVIHNVNHATKKAAKDAARNAGQGKPMHHPSPTRGKPHYHSTDRAEEKIRDGVHYNYPE